MFTFVCTHFQLSSVYLIVSYVKHDLYLYVLVVILALDQAVVDGCNYGRHRLNAACVVTYWAPNGHFLT